MKNHKQATSNKQQATSNKQQATKILYVEDNPVNLALVRKLLAGAGYDVIEAGSGIEGVRAAREEMPDLIIMDINLPDMDGYEASTRIKGMNGLKDTPIVALTAKVQPGDREMSLAAGCDGYISKPIDVATFVGEIERYLGGKRERVKKEDEARHLKEYSRRLVGSLEKKVEELDKLNKELERRVEERTKDLEQLNMTLKFALEDAETKNDYITELNHDLEIANAELEEKNRELEEKRKIIEESQQEMGRLLRERTRQKMELEKTLEELGQTQSQLLQSEKMASIGQLAAGVAHEINNPIGFINSNIGSLGEYFEDIMELLRKYEEGCERLCDKSEETAAFHREVEEIKERIDYEFLLDDIEKVINETRDGTERVSKIVQDLKEFSYVDKDEVKEYADINHWLDSTLNIVRNELKYKAKVIKEYGDIPQVKCYPHQLSQVFMNLLVNASQAIEGKGEIRIKSCLEDGNVLVTVSDTGRGMPAGIMDRIFEPFFTTKAVGKGTGLGLSVSYGIIEKHGGTLSVESEEGKGTTFTIELPVAYEEE